MPELHLLRHAKSSWKADTEDHERPLNKRGRETAGVVGRHLRGAVGQLDLALCSSARRTRRPSNCSSPRLSAQPRCMVEDGLYLADCATLLNRLNGSMKPWRMCC